MKTNYIFFDCWDTLIQYHEDSRDYDKGLYPYLLNESGKKASSDDIMRFEEFRQKVFGKFFGEQNLYELPFEHLLRLALNLSGFTLSIPESMWEEKNNSYLLPQPVDGIIDFLEFCRAYEIGTAVLSNTIFSYRSTRRAIESTLKINLDDYFSFLMVSSEVGPKKPNNLFFEAGMAKAGVTTKDNPIYVGDSPVADVLGSLNAGMKPAYFNWKNNPSTRANCIANLFSFADYRELKEFILQDGEYAPSAKATLDLGIHKNEW